MWRLYNLLKCMSLENFDQSVSVRPGEWVSLSCTTSGGCTPLRKKGDSRSVAPPSLPTLGICYQTLLTQDEKCGRPAPGNKPITYEQCCATVNLDLWFWFNHAKKKLFFHSQTNEKISFRQLWFFENRLEKHGVPDVFYVIKQNQFRRHNAPQ